MKKIIFCLFLTIICRAIHATPVAVDSIGVVTGPKGTMTQHRVENGENWFSISRKYKVNYTELRLVNKEAPDMLRIGLVINIPSAAKPNDPRFQKNYLDKTSSTPATTAPETPKIPDPVVIPKAPEPAPPTTTTSSAPDGTYRHTVVSGQTVFSISKIYGVQPSDVSQWNKLKNNSIELGQVLVIKNSQGPVLPLDYTSGKKVTPVSRPQKVTPETPAAAPSAETSKPEPSVVVAKPEVKIIKEKPSNKKTISGYIFAGNRKDITETGVATWMEDEEVNPNKYYALHPWAPVGTVIRVKNRMNDKTVFVKVVGSLPDTGDNSGVLIKISKAGADQLGVYDKKFQVELLYGVSEK